MVAFFSETGERCSFPPSVSGVKPKSTVTCRDQDGVFSERVAVLHDLAVKECLWERKNLFRKAVRSFVFPHQGDSSLVPASGYAPGRWGNRGMNIPAAGACSFCSPVDRRVRAGSQGGSGQHFIQSNQTCAISILPLK